MKLFDSEDARLAEVVDELESAIPESVAEHDLYLAALIVVMGRYAAEAGMDRAELLEVCGHCLGEPPSDELS